MLSILSKAGLNSSNWETTYLNVYPNSSIVNGSTVTYGQIASQELRITIPIIDSNGSTVGKIYDALAQIDNININGLTFDLQDKTSSLVKARELAFAEADQRARDYAAVAGITLSSVVSITDTQNVVGVSSGAN